MNSMCQRTSVLAAASHAPPIEKANSDDGVTVDEEIYPSPHWMI
jgi:hypothetical protein